MSISQVKKIRGPFFTSIKLSNRYKSFQKTGSIESDPRDMEVVWVTFFKNKSKLWAEELLKCSVGM